jgi:hypothetical protein
MIRRLVAALRARVRRRLSLAERNTYLAEIIDLQRKLDDARDERDHARAVARRYQEKWMGSVERQTRDRYDVGRNGAANGVERH